MGGGLLGEHGPRDADAGGHVLSGGGAPRHAIACRYCRTGSALDYLRNKAAGRLLSRRRGKKEEREASLHDPACALYEVDPETDRDGPEITLYCQNCGRERVTDRWRWALRPTDIVSCPACLEMAPHHPAPREIVEAGECLCGACRTDRFFREMAAC